MELFAEDSKPQSLSLGVNPAFASQYKEKKRGEELSKLQDKYGKDYVPGDSDSESSTDYSSEDSDAELDTPAVDVAIFKTLAKIRAGDPSIYESTRKVFDELEETSLPSSSKAKSTKPIRMKDLERLTLLKQGSQPYDEEIRPTPYQEEQALKAEVTAAFHADSGSDDDLLVPREKTTGEEELEDEAYREFLLSSVGGQAALESLLSVKEAENGLFVEEKGEGRKEKKKKKAKKDADAAAGDDDAFLRDYILNRGWLDKAAKHVPTHEEVLDKGKKEEVVAGPSGANALPAYKPLDRTIDDSEDEEFEDKAEEYETKYNFRFEDQAAGDIVTHARSNETTARRTDDTRKKAREARAERKAAERAEKEAARSRIKELKRKEIMDKLQQIQSIAGTNDASAFDLEGDFDEAEHERQMEKMFGEDYYAEEDPDGKPSWADDIDNTDIAPEEQGLEQAQVEEDAAYDPSAPVKKDKKDKKKKDKKGKGKATAEEVEQINAEDLEDAVNQLDPAAQSALADEMDKLYELDHEDMIDDLPTRFSYTQVPVPEGGLTPAQILMATDQELNSLVGLKKLAAYREGPTANAQPKRQRMKELQSALGKRKWGGDLPRKDEQVDLEKYTRKRQKLPAGGATSSANAGEGEKPKKRLGKKERQKLKQAEDAPAVW